MASPTYAQVGRRETQRPPKEICRDHDLPPHLVLQRAQVKQDVRSPSASALLRSFLRLELCYQTPQAHLVSRD